ncbi:MAG: MauE/DoxX family redox-associated membrane protein [Bryobacteraceae bacterium]
MARNIIVDQGASEENGARIRVMEDSIAHPHLRARAFELPAWKSFLSLAAAILIGLLFLVAGIWKITDPYGAATRMAQFRVPWDFAHAGAILLGITETAAGILLFVPRFRRWGAWLTGLLLVVFMIYVGFHYEALRGEECSCFPWIKRAIGPGFFIGDALMLVLALVAGAWARPSEGLKGAAVILGAVTICALASFGISYARQTGVEAPSTITVDGKPVSLHQGKVLLYFFDPECSHCFLAAKEMAGYQWNDVKVVAVPTTQAKFAEGFLQDTGLDAGITYDAALLRETFTFAGAGPHAIALKYGRQQGAFPNFEGDQPETGLRQLGFIE